MVERDIYEVANQLGGYIDEATPAPLASFLRRESREAAKLAARIAELEAEVERLRTLVMVQSRAIHSPEALSHIGVVKDAEAARDALRELSNVKMDLSLEDWCRISNTILSALEPAAPEGQQEAAGCEWCVDGLQADGETPCPTCTRPAEQAVTDEMVRAVVKAIRPYTRDTLFFDEHQILVRAALKAAMEAGRHG